MPRAGRLVLDRVRSRARRACCASATRARRRSRSSRRTCSTVNLGDARRRAVHGSSATCRTTSRRRFSFTRSSAPRPDARRAISCSAKSPSGSSRRRGRRTYGALSVNVQAVATRESRCSASRPAHSSRRRRSRARSCVIEPRPDPVVTASDEDGVSALRAGRVRHASQADAARRAHDRVDRRGDGRRRARARVDRPGGAARDAVTRGIRAGFAGELASVAVREREAQTLRAPSPCSPS